jgi:hypothetical protein
MRLGQLLAAVGLGVAAWMLPLGSACADTVMYDSAGFIQGQQSFVESFNITSPGTLTVSLSSVSWLDTVSDLSAFVSTPSGVLGSAMGPGTESTNVQPGMIYVHWFGDASGAYDLGVYGLKVTFQPMTPVALPATFLLLLSGIGLMLAGQYRRPVTALKA